MSPKETGNTKAINLDVKVFPNPTNDIVTLTYNFDDEIDRYFELQDVTGKKLLKFCLLSSENKISFSTSSLVSGMFFYKISSVDDVIVTTGKLTIIH